MCASVTWRHVTSTLTAGKKQFLIMQSGGAWLKWHKTHRGDQDRNNSAKEATTQESKAKPNTIWVHLSQLHEGFPLQDRTIWSQQTLQSPPELTYHCLMRQTDANNKYVLYKSTSVVYYIYLYILGICLGHCLCSLILLTLFISLLCMHPIYTYFILLSYSEPTIITPLFF